MAWYVKYTRIRRFPSLNEDTETVDEVILRKTNPLIWIVSAPEVYVKHFDTRIEFFTKIPDDLLKDKRILDKFDIEE